MRSCLWIVFFFLLLAGCSRKPEIPKDVLSQAKMQRILWDLTRADLFLTDFRFRKDSTLDRELESIKMYQQIFSLHKTSKEQFQKSFAFYKAHPSLFRAIVDTLDRRNNENAPTQLAHPENNKDTHSRSIQNHLFQRDSSRIKKKLNKKLN